MAALTIRAQVAVPVAFAALAVLAVGGLALRHAARSDRDLRSLRERQERLAADAIVIQRFERARAEADAVQERADRFRAVTIALMAVSIAGVIALGWWVSSSVAAPLEALARDLDERSAGPVDLVRPVPRAGPPELQALAGRIERIVGSVGAAIRQVQTTGIEIVSALTGIASAARALEDSIERHREATRDAAASARRITTSSAELADSMTEVSTTSERTAAAAGGGRESLERMAEAMAGMEQATVLLADKLDVIDEKASNIRKVVETIHKVAEETNLLSLNAGIEAEKAGELGLGFAVVAREIRRLADQTAGSTFDIDQIVEEMRAAITSGVMGIETFGSEVLQGVDASRRVGAQLSRVVEEVQTLSPRFAAALEAALDQSRTARAIDAALAQLAGTTDATLRSLAETGSSLSRLRDVVGALQAEAARFRVG